MFLFQQDDLCLVTAGTDSVSPNVEWEMARSAVSKSQWRHAEMILDVLTKERRIGET